MQAAEAKATAARLGLEVEVVFAENNAIQQIHQLYQGHPCPRGRAASGDRDRGGEPGRDGAPGPQRAQGWDHVGRPGGRAPYLERLRAEDSRAPIYSVSVDEEEIGHIQAQQFRVLGASWGQRCSPVPAGPPRVRRPPWGRVGRGSIRGSAGSGIVLKAGVERGLDRGERLPRRHLLAPAQDDETTSRDRHRGDHRTTPWPPGRGRAIQQLRPQWARLPFTGCDGLPSGGTEPMVAQGQARRHHHQADDDGPRDRSGRAQAGRAKRFPPDLILHAQSHPPLGRLGR